MMAELEFELLFESRLVRVTDVRCHAHRSGPGEEEPTESPRLIFPRRGVFECHRGQETITADCNTVLLFNGEEAYRISHPVEDGDDCSVLVFPPEILGSALEEVGLAGGAGSRPFSRNHVILDPRTQYAQRSFHHLLRKDFLDPLGRDEAAMLILGLVTGQIGRGLSGSPFRGRPATAAWRRRLAERARVLIAAEPEADTSLHELARTLCCSPFHLARLFHAEVGNTLHHYRLRLRLGQALERLAQGERDLSRLAVDLGFASHSHFSSSFKRFFGRTPNEVRATLNRRQLLELRKILIAS